MKNNFAGLKGTWEQLGVVTDSAINWLHGAKTVPSVKSEYDASLGKLEELASEIRSRALECNSRSCIGLFGESQVGKSYLVSTFASDCDGKLMTCIGGQMYDFIKDINPDGGGKESTGLVTRFSTQNDISDNKEFPVQLRLLRECEIAKILLDSYFNDFDSDVGVVDSDKLNDVKNRLSQVKIGGTPYVQVDEIISLQRFIKSSRKSLYESLGDDYWTLARRRLIYADTDFRAEYYSILWGNVGDGVFTNLFKRLANTLQQLGSVREVLAPASSILPPDRNKAESLINVDALNKLGSEHDELIQVLANYERRSVKKSELAALTAELCINIANTPKQSLLKNMDMLDFPGYRGRLQCTEHELRESVFSGNNSRIPELFLRGKVSYLFSRYADTMEINTLVFCTSADNQVNSKMNDALRRWIETTQGSNPLERAKHQCGLIWAMTKFDKRISSDLDKDSSSYGRNGLLKQVALERFGSEKWFENWDGSEDAPKPFKNIFLVRKPGLTESVFIDCNNGFEKGVKADFKEKISSMRQSFVNDPDIVRYVKDPEAAWDAMMEPNDGGVGRICKSISYEAADEARYQAMKNLIQTQCENGYNVLKKWYSPEDLAELQAQRMNALRSIVNSIKKKENENLKLSWPSLLKLFSLNELEIKTLYLQDDSLCVNDEDEQLEEGTSNNEEGVALNETDNSSNKAQATDAMSDDELFDFDDWDAEEEPVLASSSPENNNQSATNKKAQIPVRTENFGNKIFRKWVDSVREKASSFKPTSLIPLPTQDMNFVADMMIGFARKYDLEQKLTERLNVIERTRTTKEKAWPVVVNTVRMMISDFLAYHNCETKVGPELDENKLPILSEKPINPGKQFSKNWVSNFTSTLRNSDDVRNENGLSEAQNRELGHLCSDYQKYGKVNG